MPLSPHEQQLLAEIERDLRSHDPQLAETLSVTASVSSEPARFPLCPRHLAALVALLLALILVHAIPDNVDAAASAALTGGLILPWLASAVRTTTTPRDHATTASSTEST
jgi:hypothetical protein